MRIRMNVATKVFLFCFGSLLLISGLVGAGVLDYVNRNAVEQYATAMNRTVSMMRDGVDQEIHAIRTLSMQIYANRSLQKNIGQLLDRGCHLVEAHNRVDCQEYWGSVNLTMNSFVASNRAINMITLMSDFDDPQKIRGMIGQLGDRQVTSDWSGVPVQFVTSSSTDLKDFVLSKANVDVLLSFQAGDERTHWLDTKISPFFVGWDDRLLHRNAQNRIMNLGYKSPAFTLLSRFERNGFPYTAIIEVSSDLIRKELGSVSNGDNLWMVINDEGKLMYHPDAEQTGSELGLQQLKPADQLRGYGYIKNPEGQKVLLNSANLTTIKGWSLLSVTPIADIPTVDYASVFWGSLILALVIAIVSLLIVLFAQQLITNPINRLSSAISSVEHGATSIGRIAIETGDEIGALGRAMNFVGELLERITFQAEQVNISRNKVQYLLDHSGHGMITFGPDLMIHSEYSSEMKRIYSNDFVGRHFVSLTFPQEYRFLIDLFEELFQATNEGMQQTYLSLMPSEVVVRERIYQLAYKMVHIETGLACMVVFTDLTDKRGLESRLEEESRMMKMVIKAVLNRNDVLKSIDSFRRFALVEIAVRLDGTLDVRQKYELLFRQVHTFKGTFSQFHFLHLSTYLHELEGRLTEMVAMTYNEQELERVLNPSEMLHQIHKDESVLYDVLGASFFEKDKKSSVDDSKIDQLEEDVLARLSAEERVEVLRLFRQLRYKSFRDLLESYPSFVNELADGLGKFLNPLEIEGGETIVDPEHYLAFTQSLVHVFRNILDHGIESIDQRLQAGKNERGEIHCIIRELDDGLEIRIADDGRGIDRKRVIEKAIEKGMCTSDEAATLGIERVIEFLFADDFSTRDEVTELSGRGIGMSAVRAESEKIGGRMTVETVYGEGTTFIFWVPIIQLG